MKRIFFTSIAFAALVIAAMFAARGTFRTDTFLSDIGGINNFIGVFGTLYGIMAAFVVFEVWGQYNRTVELIDREAAGLLRLFELGTYFRDHAFTKELGERISAYASATLASWETAMGKGEPDAKSGEAFSRISDLVRDVTFNDDHDATVFDHVLAQYGDLSGTRAARISQASARLPVLLKIFFLMSSGFVLTLFVFMPFEIIGYAILTVGILSFMLSLVFQLIEDLDNPFIGYWNITPEKFSRIREMIEKSAG